jgi:hypothetical protein
MVCFVPYADNGVIRVGPAVGVAARRLIASNYC